MKIKEIKNYLIENNLFKKPQVKRLGKGNNYQVYIVEENGKKFTLRMERDDIVTENFLRKEYYILKFLQEEKINFVPKPVFYDKKKKILLLTYISGKEVGVNDLTPKQRIMFVRQLNNLHKLSYARYRFFCRKNNIKIDKPASPLAQINKYGVKRFRIIDKNSNLRDMVEWIRPRLKENVKYVKGLKIKQKDLMFFHGDLAGANIFLDKNKIYFIDWDKGKFKYNIDFCLGYMFIHGEIDSPRVRNHIIKEYARINKTKAEDLKEIITDIIKVTKINDIIWAVMMYTLMKKDGFKGYGQYLIMGRKRIEEFEEMFGKYTLDNAV